MSHADEKTVTVEESIGGNVVKRKWWWLGDKHIPEGPADCCGNTLEYDPIVKSIVTTSTFHHLGHSGHVFIHSDRHNGIAAAAVDEILLCIPAGNPDRQVHLRYTFKGSAQTGTLDADVELRKGVTVSATGTSEPIVCTNDANLHTSGVTMYKGPTVTDDGERKVLTSILGTNKGTGNEETNVPEWILTPDGENLRYYLFRSTNNGAGLLDLIPAIFFYDTKAEPV